MVGKPQAHLRFRAQEFSKTLRVSVGSDFARDPNSKQSTTGLVARVGEWLNDADTTVLPVGRAEYYAVDMGRAVPLMLRSLYADVRIDMECPVETDSSTAGSLSEPVGPSLRRINLHTTFLGTQERVRDGVLLQTTQHAADVATKPGAGPTLQKYRKAVGLMFTSTI